MSLDQANSPVAAAGVSPPPAGVPPVLPASTAGVLCVMLAVSPKLGRSPSSTVFASEKNVSTVRVSHFLGGAARFLAAVELSAANPCCAITPTTTTATSIRQIVVGTRMEN